MVLKIKHYLNPQARFVVMRDQDATPDCGVIKEALLTRCGEAGRQEVSLVSIACRELESFYLADLAAVELGLCMTGLVKQQKNRKFKKPDYLHNPSKELMALTKQRYQKVSGSREIGCHLEINNDRSESFKNLVLGIVCRMWICRKRRPQRGHQYSKGRTCLPSERGSNVVSNRNSPKLSTPFR
ncbi:MAG: DUF4276 family protein, partial [Gallionella sp.]